MKNESGAGREDVGIEGAGLGLKPGPFLDDARKLAAEVESWPEYKRDIYVSAQGSGFKDGAGSATPPRALRAEIRDRLIAFLEESGCECDKTTGHVCESCSLLISLLAKPGEAASAEPEQSSPVTSKLPQGNPQERTTP